MATLEQLPSGKWCVRWVEKQPGGQPRKYRRYTTTTKRTAERLKIEIEDEVRARGSWLAPSDRPAAAVLRDVATDNVGHAHRVNAPRTVTRKAQMLDQLLRFLGPGATVESLTYQTLADFHG